MDTAKPRHNQKTQTPTPWQSRWRWAISALLVIHLAAVFVPPFTLLTSSPGTVSPVAENLSGLLKPYVDVMNLNHGYAFFAPDPGPSHLVQYRLEFDDGRPPIERVFPDIERHWPRLLYHRHFMLAEQLNGDFVPPQSPWDRGRKLYEQKWRSYEQHLLSISGASRVTLQRVEHAIPPHENFFENRVPINDEQWYRVLSENPEDERSPEELP